MYETDMERYAVSTPRARRLRRIRWGVLLGILTSMTLLVSGAVGYIQERADRIN
jgi:hypothetical protein